jgi:hypothetical protein
MRWWLPSAGSGVRRRPSPRPRRGQEGVPSYCRGLQCHRIASAGASARTRWPRHGAELTPRLPATDPPSKPRAGHLVREMPGGAAAGGAPRGTGARTIAGPLAKVKSTTEDVFPAQQTWRMPRMCSASGYHLRPAMDICGHRWAGRVAYARNLLRVSSDQRRSRHPHTRWHQLAPHGTPEHS